MKCTIDYDTMRTDIRVAMARQHSELGSQQQLAKETGVSTASVSRFLSGRGLDTPLLLSILTTLGLNLDEYVMVESDK